MWNKCEVTFDCFRADDARIEGVKVLNNINGALPEGWAVHRVEPLRGSGCAVVFRIEGADNLNYTNGLHVHRSLERLGLR